MQQCKTLSQTLHLAKPGSHINEIGRSFYLRVMDKERCPRHINKEHLLAVLWPLEEMNVGFWAGAGV